MPNDTPADDRFLPAAQVLARYSISDMTLFRWLRDPAMGFPQPTYLQRRRYFKLADLVAWERARATREASNARAA